MKRLFILGFLTVVAQSVLADPFKGQKVLFQGNFGGRPALLEKTIVDGPLDRNQWLVHQRQLVGEKANEWDVKTSIWSSPQLNRMIQNCVTLGGRREMVTVPAGTFDSCAIKATPEGTVVWYADVPMNFIKFEIHQAGPTEPPYVLELTGYNEL